MEYEELKKKSTYKVLLKGPSGTGKTMNAVRAALEVANAGGKVLYVDTESEAAGTIVRFIEDGYFGPEVVENIEHELVSSGDRFLELLDSSVQEDYDLVVYDTLDNKHTYALKDVTDAKMKANADWNEYAVIYDYEKQLMEEMGKPECVIIGCLDPESGKKDKPKGCQTNIDGFFSTVLSLSNPVRNGEQVHEVYIENWVGDLDGNLNGKKGSGDNLYVVMDSMIDEVKERAGLTN